MHVLAIMIVPMLMVVAVIVVVRVLMIVVVSLCDRYIALCFDTLIRRQFVCFLSFLRFQCEPSVSPLGARL
jgi:hypothetical protein